MNWRLFWQSTFQLSRLLSNKPDSPGFELSWNGSVLLNALPLTNWSESKWENFIVCLILTFWIMRAYLFLSSKKNSFHTSQTFIDSSSRRVTGGWRSEDRFKCGNGPPTLLCPALVLIARSERGQTSTLFERTPQALGEEEKKIILSKEAEKRGRSVGGRWVAAFSHLYHVAGFKNKRCGRWKKKKKGGESKDGWRSRMANRWTAEMRGEPLALVIKLRNCTDNESVCLGVKTLHDTQWRGLRHLPASLEMSSSEGGKEKKKKENMFRRQQMIQDSWTLSKCCGFLLLGWWMSQPLAVGNATLTLSRMVCEMRKKWEFFVCLFVL